MPIPLQCECGKTLNVPENLAGKKIRCKQCGAAMRVPDDSLEAEEIVEDEFDELDPPPLPTRSKAVQLPAAVGAKNKKKSTSKKAAAKPAEPGIPKWVWAALILVGLGVGGIGGFFGVRAILNAAKPQPVAEAQPLTFSQHVVENGNISFDYPNGWTVESGGGTGGVPPWGTIAQDDVSVDIRADLKGAPIADIATLNPGEELPPEESAVARVHHTQYELKYQFEFEDYEELPGGFYDIPYGQGWLAEFTASGGAFGGKVHGYRLTLLGTVHQYNIICKGSDKNWERNKPVFERVMKSIGR